MPSGSSLVDRGARLPSTRPLVNKDLANAATVTLSYSGFTPSSATPTVYSYLKNATSIGSATTRSATRQTVPAYSIVVVQLHRNG